MSFSLYDATVPNYLQILRATSEVLKKGESYFSENNLDLKELIYSKLADNMAPFQFQVVSVAHHSMGALKGYEAGEFSPPITRDGPVYGDPDYEGLKALIEKAISEVEGCSKEQVDSWAGKNIIFKMGKNEFPFQIENFVNSFSIPNFYFHATTTYAFFRMRGVALGKMDFIGEWRMG